MIIIVAKTLKDFWIQPKFRDSEQTLKAWFFETKQEKWNNPSDVKRGYKNVSVIGKNRLVFNIKDNKYRLIVTIKYDLKLIFIRFIGTHEEYDKIDAKNI